MTVRAFAKTLLPRPIRNLLRPCLHYVQRLGWWSFILWQIRGVTWSDEWILIRSALTAPFLSFNNLQKWQDPTLLANAQVSVSGIGRFFLRAHCDDLFHVLPAREPAVLRAIRANLKLGDIFVDAGANIGIYTVAAARLVGDTGRVIAVEMMPDTAMVLRKHIEMNQLKNVDVVEQALSDKAAKVVVARAPKGRHGQASIAYEVMQGAREVSVTTTTLATVLVGVERIALMKMDLEGAEELALNGAGNALNRMQSVIFEDLGDARLGRIFNSRGFSVQRLDGNNCLAINLTPVWPLT